MSKPHATIRDIARKLKISISTVSRALRNAPDVNTETKKAILKLAEELNYEPNRVAQSLRIRRTNTIGIMVPEINLHFFSSCISGMQDYAAKQKYSIIICQSLEDMQIEKSNIQMMVSNRVDGLLISLSHQTTSFDHIQKLVDKNLPIILFDRVHESLNVSKVIVDDFEGAFNAVEYLINTGCKRIAYIGGVNSLYISNQRLQGYKAALEKFNLAIDDELVHQCKDFHNEVIEATKKVISLQKPPDAIFCMNDPIAIICLEVLKENGVNIPDQISLIGFTNEPTSRYIQPSITTISQPSFEMGQIAAQLLIESINDRANATTRTVVLPTTLIVRDSTRKHTTRL